MKSRLISISVRPSLAKPLQTRRYRKTLYKAYIWGAWGCLCCWHHQKVFIFYTKSSKQRRQTVSRSLILSSLSFSFFFFSKMQRDGHQALVIDFLSVLRERGSFGKIKVVKQSSQVPSAVSLTLQMGLFHLPCCHTFTPSSLLYSSSSSSPNPPVVPDFLLLPFAYLLGSFISPDAQMTLLKNSRARLLVFFSPHSGNTWRSL